MTSMETGSSSVTIDVVMTSSRQGDADFIHICSALYDVMSFHKLSFEQHEILE
ncbi:hypothetical protein ACJX0J_021085, partial [Zea mays]